MHGVPQIGACFQSERRDKSYAAVGPFPSFDYEWNAPKNRLGRALPFRLGRGVSAVERDAKRRAVVVAS